MSATSVTLMGRSAAERLMIDTCVITRVTGTSTDLQTGLVTKTTETIYSGKCRLQQRGRLSRPVDVAESYQFQTMRELQLPMSAAGVRINDVVLITASVLDPDAAGRDYWVREDWTKTHSTSRRIGIEEVEG